MAQAGERTPPPTGTQYTHGSQRFFIQKRSILAYGTKAERNSIASKFWFSMLKNKKISTVNDEFLVITNLVLYLNLNLSKSLDPDPD